MSGIPKGLIERWLHARAVGGPRAHAPHAAVIGAGSPADYMALERFHYCGGPPATWAGVLAARVGDELAGVLVVSRPTLNGWWREVRWPGLYRCGERAESAGAINRGLRTISRVVVDPRWRGVGIAHSLVRAYLVSPLTRDTEAVAAMGRVCTMFERAGMTRHEAPVAEHDVRLLGALRKAGVDARRLVEARYAERVLDRGRVRGLVNKWMRARDATRNQAGGNAAFLGAVVASRVLWRPPAYTWSRVKL